MPQDFSSEESSIQAFDPADYDISAAQIEHADWLRRTLRQDLAQLCGMSDAELYALWAHAVEQLRLGRLFESRAEFLTLIRLRPTLGRHWQGLAMTYHHEHAYTWAYTFYGAALVYDAQDGISQALRAECSLYLFGKEQAYQELTTYLATPTQDADEAVYRVRARGILAMIRL